MSDTKTPILALMEFPHISCDYCEHEVDTSGQNKYGRIESIDPLTLMISSFRLADGYGIHCDNCGKTIVLVNIPRKDYHPEYRMN